MICSSFSFSFYLDYIDFLWPDSKSCCTSKQFFHRQYVMSCHHELAKYDVWAVLIGWYSTACEYIFIYIIKFPSRYVSLKMNTLLILYLFKRLLSLISQVCLFIHLSPWFDNSYSLLTFPTRWPGNHAIWWRQICTYLSSQFSTHFSISLQVPFCLTSLAGSWSFDSFYIQASTISFQHFQAESISILCFRWGLSAYLPNGYTGVLQSILLVYYF